jgi:zinc-ribbon domain
MFCSHCGAKLNAGANFCDACGTAVVGGAAPGPPGQQPHHFDQNDALAAAGMAAPVLGRGAASDVAGYMMSKAALENLEESGRGDSAAASMARTGLAISQFKIVAGIIGFIIFIVIAISIFSSMQHAQDQFNNQFNQLNNTGINGNTGCVVTNPNNPQCVP